MKFFGAHLIDYFVNAFPCISPYPSCPAASVSNRWLSRAFDTIVFNVGILGIGEGNKDEIYAQWDNPIAEGTVTVPFTNGVGSGAFVKVDD